MKTFKGFMWGVVFVLVGAYCLGTLVDNGKARQQNNSAASSASVESVSPEEKKVTDFYAKMDGKTVDEFVTEYKKLDPATKKHVVDADYANGIYLNIELLVSGKVGPHKYIKRQFENAEVTTPGGTTVLFSSNPGDAGTTIKNVETRIYGMQDKDGQISLTTSPQIY